MSGSTVTINALSYDAERSGWFVNCAIQSPDGSRIGPEFVALPESATEAEIKTALLALYGLA